MLGWFERDYSEYGYEFGTAGSRIADLGEALPRIRARWAKANPAPTRDIPILIGGGGEKVTLRIVAQHAHIWHSFGDPQRAEHLSGVLNEWCEKVGRDPTGIERSITLTDKQMEAADEYVRVGITHLVMGFSGPDYDMSPLAELISWRDGRSAKASTAE